MTGQHRMPASIRRPPPPDRHTRALPWIGLAAGMTFVLGLFGAAHPVIRPTVDVTAEREPVAVQTWTPRALPAVTVATRATESNDASLSVAPRAAVKASMTSVHVPSTTRPSACPTEAAIATVAPATATTPATTTAQATADTTTAAETTTAAATTTATTEPTLLPAPTDVLPTELPVETTSEETP